MLVINCHCVFIKSYMVKDSCRSYLHIAFLTLFMFKSDYSEMRRNGNLTTKTQDTFSR